MEKKTIRIVAVSDTHDTHTKLLETTPPEADLFIHAGDFTQNSYRGELARFREFLKALPYKQKVVIAGNHDFVLDEQRYINKHKPKRHPYQKMDPSVEKKLLQECCTYLCHEAIEILGLKVYGSPYQPLYYNWGFQYHQTRAQVIWNDIPHGLDLLVTHGPPYGVLDQNEDGEHLGCKALREAVLAKKPKVHIFGHVHHSTGSEELGMTRCYNVAVLNEAYALTKGWSSFTLQI